MNKQTEALKMAIEALEVISFEYGQILDIDEYGGVLPSETDEAIINAYKAKQACKEALEHPVCSKCGKPTQQGECFYGCRQEQPEVSDAELVSYRQGYEQGRFDYEMDLELGKIEQHEKLHKVKPSEQPAQNVVTVPTMIGSIQYEQPAQEPVAWVEEEFNAIAYAYRSCPAHEIKMVSERYQNLVDYVLSIAHPAPSWQGLSNDRIREIGEQCELNNNGTLNWIDFARAIEQALKEKNKC